MRTTGSGRAALLVGALVAALSALAFPAVLQGFHRELLQIRLSAPDLSMGPGLQLGDTTIRALQIDGAPAAADRQVSPGLHHLAWQRRYRGGHERRVGHTQLVGPLQDPLTPPCSTFLLVGQDFLDDGEASEGSMAHLLAAQVREELSGTTVWPLGPFRSLTAIDMHWTRWSRESLAATMRTLFAPEGSGQALNGHLHIGLGLRFARARVRLHLKLVPILAGGELSFELLVDAELDLESRVLQWVSDLFDGNDRASVLIHEEVTRGLRQVLSKPPPIALGDGESLEFSFCADRQIEFHEQGFVAVPLAIEVEGFAPAPPLAVTRSAPHDAPLGSPLALDIDRNGLNAILHRLWSAKILDRHLASSLVTSFNEHESVRKFLSLRLAGAHFHLPPTVDFSPDASDALRLRAAASASIRDGEVLTDARLYTEVDVGLDLLQAKDDGERQALTLGAMDLTCLPEAGLLRACYAGILQQVRANREPLQRALAGAFSSLLVKLFTERDIGGAETPGRFHLDHVSFEAADAILRGELHGQLIESSR